MKAFNHTALIKLDSNRDLFTKHGLHTNNKGKELAAKKIVKGKAIPVTGHEGPWCCERSRFPYFLDTDGSKVVSLTRRPPFTPQENSWYSFLLEA
jgi:hypothetical protein